MEGPSELVKQITNICESVPTLIDTSLCYSEYCYQQIIRQLLNRAGLNCELEAPVYFKTKEPNPINFGWGKIDVLVRGEKEVVIIELKANVKYSLKAEKQLQRYLVHFPTTLQKVGLLFLYNSVERYPCIKRVFK